MRRVSPSPRLAPFVRDFMVVETDRDVDALRLPEPGLVLGIRYRGSATVAGSLLPTSTCTGLLGTARRMHTAAGSGVLLARLRTGAAPAFFATPIHELFGLTMRLDDLMPRDVVARAHEDVSEAGSDVERVAAFETLLFSRLRRSAVDPVVRRAERAIADACGNLSMRVLAASVGLSQDTFEKRFRSAVGTSPKHHAMLTRLRHAVASYKPGMRLTDLALDAGYFDQSHFNRELRAVTGESPTRFFAASV